MITGFAIILDEDLVYVSNSKKYAFFEIILFVEKLIKSINPKNYWRLTNVLFKGLKGKEHMIIDHIIDKSGRNIFFCITGSFSSRSIEARNMVKEFSEKVLENYGTPEEIEKSSSKPEFTKIIKLITAYLWNKYRDNLEDEEFLKPSEEIKSKVIYCGISAQGLPIISKLYDLELLKNFQKNISKENIELFSSDLSAKLATITMNSQIRAKSYIKEIQFEDLKEQGRKNLILYGRINGYSLDLIASGDYLKIKEIFEELEKKLTKEPVLLQEFKGDLKPFLSLSNHIDNIVHQFDQ